MFLLDTNVVSELRRPRRTDPRVAAWADSVPPAEMFLSSITVLELETGILLLGRRDPPRGSLIRRWLENRVLPAFVDRILSVDTAVARRCAALHLPTPQPYRDSLIAATHGQGTGKQTAFPPPAVPRLPDRRHGARS
jgi:predicted nucleic acid-binding protein